MSGPETLLTGQAGGGVIVFQVPLPVRIVNVFSNLHARNLNNKLGTFANSRGARGGLTNKASKFIE